VIPTSAAQVSAAVTIVPLRMMVSKAIAPPSAAGLKSGPHLRPCGEIWASGRRGHTAIVERSGRLPGIRQEGSDKEAHLPNRGKFVLRMLGFMARAEPAIVFWKREGVTTHGQSDGIQGND
jgi:hypothetical protein